MGMLTSSDAVASESHEIPKSPVVRAEGPAAPTARRPMSRRNSVSSTEAEAAFRSQAEKGRSHRQSKVVRGDDRQVLAARSSREAHFDVVTRTVLAGGRDREADHAVTRQEQETRGRYQDLGFFRRGRSPTPVSSPASSTTLRSPDSPTIPPLPTSPVRRRSISKPTTPTGRTEIIHSSSVRSPVRDSRQPGTTTSPTKRDRARDSRDSTRLSRASMSSSHHAESSKPSKEPTVISSPTHEKLKTHSPVDDLSSADAPKSALEIGSSGSANDDGEIASFVLTECDSDAIVRGLEPSCPIETVVVPTTKSSTPCEMEPFEVPQVNVISRFEKIFVNILENVTHEFDRAIERRELWSYRLVTTIDDQNAPHHPFRHKYTTFDFEIGGSL
ncbi:hypothetical protein BC936DRAFT_137314 [Jimgerdemannia flammicorona]|uniref:Uncharacterized protein n=1 Tax=Jimgerdemannia flammicorona TaxID=994334 RepID=A0A433DMW9_9FUNG|nr:hypothetical protein BC936DRAFT_137314 [Jimgerdemannia flammicorona]